MKLKIIQTGSAGNNYLLTFSDGQSLIIEVGKGTFEKFVKEEDIKGCVGYIYSHKHNDHSGDAEVFENHGFKEFENDPQKTVKVYPFEVKHDVPNNGFFIVNNETQEGLVFITDFTEIVDFQQFISTYKVLLSTGFLVDFAVECSYCDFLAKKLPDNEKYGLYSHFSMEKLIEFMKVINKYGQDYSLVTIHASGRNFTGELSKRMSSVCPADYVVGHILKRTNKAVHFGINGCTYYL